MSNDILCLEVADRSLRVKRGEEEPPLSLVAHSLRPSLLARIGPSSLGSS